MNSTTILGGLVGLLVLLVGTWLHGRSAGKQAAAKTQADDALKADKAKIAGLDNQGVADDIAKRAGK